jgi:hypothetical protein
MRKLLLCKSECRPWDKRRAPTRVCPDSQTGGAASRRASLLKSPARGRQLEVVSCLLPILRRTGFGSTRSPVGAQKHRLPRPSRRTHDFQHAIGNTNVTRRVWLGMPASEDLRTRCPTGWWAAHCRGGETRQIRLSCAFHLAGATRGICLLACQASQRGANAAKERVVRGARCPKPPREWSRVSSGRPETASVTAVDRKAVIAVGGADVNRLIGERPTTQYPTAPVHRLRARCVLDDFVF